MWDLEGRHVIPYQRIPYWMRGGMFSVGRVRDSRVDPSAPPRRLESF